MQCVVIIVLCLMFPGGKITEKLYRNKSETGDYFYFIMSWSMSDSAVFLVDYEVAEGRE